MKAYWKCAEISPIWRLAARGRHIYMMCVDWDADIGRECPGVRVTGRRVFADGQFCVRIVFVPHESEARFLAWAGDKRDSLAVRYGNEYIMYCAQVWDAV